MSSSTPDQPNGPPPLPSPTNGPPLPRQEPVKPWLNFPTMLLILAGSLLVAWLLSRMGDIPRSKIDYSFFWQQVEAGNVLYVESQGQTLEGRFKEPPDAPPPLEPKTNANSEIPTDLTDRSEKTGENEKKVTKLHAHFVTTVPILPKQLSTFLRSKGVHLTAEKETDSNSTLMWTYLAASLGLMLLFFFIMRRLSDRFSGGSILSGFARSPAKRYELTKKPVTFADVAGLEGVKNDLQEIVEFLKNPERFQRLGGRVPKGVLLMGPPGTGKTLLARAVAGEAGVPFFSISGSEFIQMFVGVGASRVRDMFRTAKENAPCILFIDEIDAVGRHRGAGLGGGHDEREQTLNQILSEMDGFSQTESVIVLAATNRPDVLDPALLRPGRFDRHITVDRPNHKARVAIFRVHCRNVTLGTDVDLEKLAAGAVGLTGADIRNLVNEAALWATRNGKDKVEMEDFEYARDKILMGPKREEMLIGREKTMTAYHESGHALLAWLLPGMDRLHKVTIIPRGRALGVTQLLPEEDRLNIGESDLRNRIVFILGGRAAEKLVYNEYSAGAENDLSQVTKLARRMVAHWGMSERIGPVAYRTGEEHPFLGREIHEQREFSEHTAQLIDEEVAIIIHAAADRASQMLTEHRAELDKLAAALEEHEVLDEVEIEQLLGPSAYRKPNSPPIQADDGQVT